MTDDLRELIAKAHNTQAPQSITLWRGLTLKARVSDRLEVLAYRHPSRARASEAKAVCTALRKLEFVPLQPIPLHTRRGSGWQIACLSEDERAGAALEQAERAVEKLNGSAALLEGRRESRLELALRLMLEAHLQHPGSMWIVECWREGLAQLGDAGLEAKITELEMKLQMKKAPVTR